MGYGGSLRHSHGWNIHQAGACRLPVVVLLRSHQSNSKSLQKLRLYLTTLSSPEQRALCSALSNRCLVIRFNQTFLCDPKPHLCEKDSSHVILERKNSNDCSGNQTQRHVCCQSLVEILFLEMFSNTGSTLK